MTNGNNIDEFRGTTKEAIADLKEDIKELQTETKSINSKLIVLFILLAVALIERIPNLISLVLAR